MFSLNGSVLSGKTTLGTRGVGDWWDDLVGGSDNENTAIDPTESSSGPRLQQSYGALPKFGSCPDGMVDDPVNPSQFCVLSAAAKKKEASCNATEFYSPVTLKCEPKIYNGALTGCPSGSWQATDGSCHPVICPTGTEMDQKTFQCKKPSSSSGSAAPKVPVAPQTAPPVEPPPSMMAGISPMMIVAGVLGFAALGAVVYKVRKDRAAKGGMSPNEYED